MEKELFNWDEWDGEPECMTFYNIELKKPIGKFPEGTKFNSATILQGGSIVGGVLQLTNLSNTKNPDGGIPLVVMGQFKLHYKVGEEIPFK